jgi:hypothetical protein
LVEHEWKPSEDLLKKTREEAAEEYDFLRDRRDFPEIKEAYDNLIKEYDGGARKNVTTMLEIIDYEHSNLLVSNPKEQQTDYPLPSLLSGKNPIGAALTARWAPPSPKTKSNESNTVIIANTVVTLPDATLVADLKNQSLKGKSVEAKKEKDKKDQAANSIATSPVPEDFKTEQNVTLSISTVLNSSAVLDRIEYLSTYVYIQPFPFPANGDIVLEKEFWREFFSFHKYRNPLLWKDTSSHDMKRAIQDMRVRVVSIGTDVIKNIDLGSLTRTTDDKLIAGISATAVAPPTLTGITPSLNYTREAGSSANLKLQQELDQRSTYINPSGNFLRITQRGMHSVNLAGNFVENITLSIPAGQDKIPVLVPSRTEDMKAGQDKISSLVPNKTKDIKCQVKRLSQPLYSRVDAYTVSIVVARQTTELAKSTKDFSHIDDPSNAAFVTGVTPVYRLTLWQHEREMYEVMTGDIFGKDPALAKNKNVFFTTFEGERPAPLILAGFQSEEQDELMRKIQKLAKKDLRVPVHLPIGNDTITIGLPNDTNNPVKLVGFVK